MLKNIVRFFKAHGIALIAVAALAAVIKLTLHFSFFLSFLILLIAYFLIGFAIDVISEKKHLNKAQKSLNNGETKAEKNRRSAGSGDEAGAEANERRRPADYDFYIPSAADKNAGNGNGLRKLSSDMQSIIAASPDEAEKGEPEIVNRGRRKEPERLDDFFNRKRSGGLTGRTKEHDEYIRGTDYTYSRFMDRNNAMSEREAALTAQEAAEDAVEETHAPAFATEEAVENAANVVTGTVAAASEAAAAVIDPDDDVKIYEKPGYVKEATDAALIREMMEGNGQVPDSAPVQAAAVQTAETAGKLAETAEAPAAPEKEEPVQETNQPGSEVLDNELFFTGPDVPGDTELTENISEQVDRMVNENQRSVIRKYKYRISTDPSELTRTGSVNENERTSGAANDGRPETEIRSHISSKIDMSNTLFGAVGEDIYSEDEDYEPERDTVVADSAVVNSLFPSRKNEKHKKPSLEEFRKKKENLGDSSRDFNEAILGRTGEKSGEKTAEKAFETAAEKVAEKAAEAGETAAEAAKAAAGAAAGATAAAAVSAAKDTAHEKEKKAADELDEELKADRERQLKEALIRKKYEVPPVELLAGPRGAERPVNINAEDDPKAQKLISTLESFGVGAKIIGVMRGPAVTRYELQPNPGVKVSRIVSLSDDIALNLASTGVRIEAPIPGKEAVGIEVPNSQVEIVALRQVIESDEFKSSQSPLTVALGRDIAGKNIVADIARMPHLLIAGATGSGKSVCINTIVASVLYKAGPEDVRMIMIDPKIVELGVYNGIPHLLVPVVTNPKKAAGALCWAVAEMEKRYTVFSENNVRDIKAYNTVAEKNKKLTKMPQILIIIDELADLMMVAAKEIEDSVIRLAQKARAAGLHIIIATQRPSVDVITGLIKANIPSRIAFAVTSQIDSRTILDGGGAEKLLGRGDMLFHPIGMSKPLRVQGAFVSDSEIEALADSVRNNYGMALYSDEIQNSIDQKDKDKDKAQNGASAGGEGGEDEGDADIEMIDAAAQLAIEYKQLSTSFLQRKLRLGYSRASRIVDTLEAEGLISEADGSKPRQLLMTKEEWEKHIAETRG